MSSQRSFSWRGTGREGGGGGGGEGGKAVEWVIHTCKVTFGAIIHEHLWEGMGRIALKGIDMMELKSNGSARSVGSICRESEDESPLLCSGFFTCLIATSSPVFSKRAK